LRYIFKFGRRLVGKENGTSSIINYNKDGVWRNIRVEIKNNAIVRYTEINPKTNDKDVIE